MIFFHKIFNFLNSKPQEIKLLEKRIKYNFNNLSLLHTALTHRSIKNPHKGNYERLEFLGDAIIDHVVSHWLFIKYLKLRHFKKGKFIDEIIFSILSKDFFKKYKKTKL